MNDIVTISVSEATENVAIAIAENADVVSILVTEAYGVTQIIVEEIGQQGIKGEQGDPGESVVLITGEIATGIIDGSNATFSTQFPFKSGSLMVFSGSATMWPNADYQIISNQSVQLVDSPLPGEIIVFNYQKN